MNSTQKADCENALSLLLKAHEVTKFPDRIYEFACPVCGGKANASKAGSNGHVHVHCDKCGINIIE